jgi:glutamate dehydrogenase/leucine dehydrogenase
MNHLNVAPGLKGKSFIIEGFGQVGQWTAQYLHNYGAKLVGIVEKDGSIYDPEGIDPLKVKEHFKTTNSVRGFTAQSFEDHRVMFSACDILVPAYLHNVITSDNAHLLQCKIIAEAAYGPVSFNAEEILLKRGIQVFPDVLLGSGASVMAYFEWLKNLSHVG